LLTGFGVTEFQLSMAVAASGFDGPLALHDSQVTDHSSISIPMQDTCSDPQNGQREMTGNGMT
jgi:hypothetical protein